MNDFELCQALKAELAFLNEGGYGRSFRGLWRPTLLIRDSNLCLNSGRQNAPISCRNCKLARLVPAEKRETAVPCHHIPLNAVGDTIASFIRLGPSRSSTIFFVNG